jgi:hypothetical protein
MVFSIVHFTGRLYMVDRQITEACLAPKEASVASIL